MVVSTVLADCSGGQFAPVNLVRNQWLLSAGIRWSISAVYPHLFFYHKKKLLFIKIFRCHSYKGSKNIIKVWLVIISVGYLFYNLVNISSRKE
jgi:hypothetical protein